MRIAVEGANNVGKSTFIHELLKRLNDHKVVHTDFAAGNDHYNSFDNEPNIVFDRFAVGDFVYNDPRQMNLIDIKNHVEKLDKLIVLEASSKVVKRSAMNKFEKVPSAHEIQNEMSKFVICATELNVDFWYIQRRDENRYKFIERVNGEYFEICRSVSIDGLMQEIVERLK